MAGFEVISRRSGPGGAKASGFFPGAKFQADNIFLSGGSGDLIGNCPYEGRYIIRGNPKFLLKKNHVVNVLGRRSHQLRRDQRCRRRSYQDQSAKNGRWLGIVLRNVRNARPHKLNIRTIHLTGRIKIEARTQTCLAEKSAVEAGIGHPHIQVLADSSGHSRFNGSPRTNDFNRDLGAFGFDISADDRELPDPLFAA